MFADGVVPSTFLTLLMTNKGITRTAALALVLETVNAAIQKLPTTLEEDLEALEQHTRGSAATGDVAGTGSGDFDGVSVNVHPGPPTRMCSKRTTHTVQPTYTVQCTAVYRPNVLGDALMGAPRSVSPPSSFVRAARQRLLR